MTALLSLGSFKFVAKKNSFQTITIDKRFRWNQLERIKGPPALQWGGSELERLSIRGEVYTLLAGINPFAELENYAKNGDPKIMLNESGENLGKWVIEEISEVLESFSKNGHRKSEFTISLTRYYGDL